MKRRGLLLLGLCAACRVEAEDPRVRVANWAEGQPPPPFSSEDPEAVDCRIELAFEPEHLPAAVEVPAFEPTPELEAALNSVAPGDCADTPVLSYALSTDFDADGDADILTRRPLSGGDDCEIVALGVVRDLATGPGEFEPVPVTRHLNLVGSLDDDQHADLIAIDEGCLRVIWYHDDVGFEHEDTTTLGCGEEIGNDGNTATSWDLDRDGDLDVLLATGDRNYYYRNDEGSFTEMIGEAGLTPAGAYTYDPAILDPLRAESFYIYCDHEDPFDPLSSTICQVDNDGLPSFNEAYRCDAAGACRWVDDRIDAACDVVTRPMFERYLCDTPVTPAQFDNLVVLGAQALGLSSTQVLRIAHSSGTPAAGDNSNPMSIARFDVWPYAFEYKAQSEGVISDTVAVFDPARQRSGRAPWLQFEPYSLDNGRSTNGHEQQTWGSVALEDGSGWPILVTVHGRDGDLGNPLSADVRAGLEQIVESDLSCLEARADSFGAADVGVTVLGPDGRLNALGELVESDGQWRSTGPITRLGNYKTVTPAWLQLGDAPREQLYLLLGSFDGVLHGYRVIERGNILRLVLDPGPGRAPHGYGAVLFVEFDGRLRGPKTVGADGVQPHVGNHRASWDFGIGVAEQATVYVLWAWGELEMFTTVAADAREQTLVYGQGQLEPPVPDELAHFVRR